MVEKTQTHMSAAAFEALPEQSTPVELIEGLLVVHGAPPVNHQRVAGKMYTTLLRNTSDGEVFYAPVSVKLDDANYYQPDVLWISATNDVCVILDDGVNGPPDLVVEVISPGTASHDRGVKFQAYQAAGVREYWIIEPDLGFLEVWGLHDGRYTQQGLYHAGERFPSPVLNTEIMLDGIFPANTREDA